MPRPTRIEYEEAFHHGGSSQKQIAEAFQLQHPGRSSFSINKIKKEISQGPWEKEIEWLKRQLNLTL